MQAAFGFLGFVSVAQAHSWIHCTDYRGDVANYEAGQCFGHPRPKNGAFPDAGAFGVDRGFDTQSGACQSYDSDSNTGTFPAATYKRGQTVTIAWPSKNHVAADCSNRFIPDTSTKLFAGAKQDTPTGLTQVPASFSDDPHVNGEIDFKGFQNCPDFCSNTDKSLCTGTFVVPASMADGSYTFQWEWVFNQGASPYVSCFEATIAGDETNAGPAPVQSPTPPPSTPTPTTAEEALCNAPMMPCDGAIFNGVNCCQSGLTCFRQSDALSVCLDACPIGQGWECDETALTCADKGEQCGGQYHDGPTCCSSGQCQKNSPYFSECRDDCPTGWECANSGQEFGMGQGGINFGLGVVMMFLILGAAIFGVLYGRCWERKKVAEAQQNEGEDGVKKLSFDKAAMELQPAKRRSTLNMPKVDQGVRKPSAPARPPPRGAAPPPPPAAAVRVSVV